ncbi:OmpH family outer membrane protein [Sphingomonas pseudosanguinis]|uniref:Skp family chaperone for outer membrane proteins n=1 Tax=Sphingomonas pseudosanguinis TaxID=413712 RepID=A0A7W6F3S8_9SPHN|nr:OmpH family outer membrane protein [Sphingomonas pseudosanguinis]MBB3879705.1 Skp family chaperone for outer membrane proteins [Sphingomonas pseudosanguinis]
MKTISKLLLAAALVAPAATVATSAQAQVNGVAVADPQGAIAGSRAWAAARQQIETTYKTQLDQAETRRTALTRELEPLVQAFQTARSQPNANQTALRTQAEQIETRQQAANQELQRLTQPAVRAQTYAVEQLQARLGEAVQNAVRAKNVSLLVSPQAVLFMQPTADITTAVTAELDKLVPTVSITPPANWQPGQGGQQAATPANAPAPAAAPAAAPARRQNSGR